MTRQVSGKAAVPDPPLPVAVGAVDGGGRVTARDRTVKVLEVSRMACDLVVRDGVGSDPIAEHRRGMPQGRRTRPTKLKRGSSRSRFRVVVAAGGPAGRPPRSVTLDHTIRARRRAASGRGTLTS
jgi:hypothetical protein